MDRRTWLDERRRAVEADYDEGAATYDDTDIRITETHARFVTQLVERCPSGGLLLDAPCGTGKYFAMVTAAGRRVVGLDQSTGMLEQARAKGLADELRQGLLQDLDAASEFDGSLTVDAMENVPPEDWPLVLANLRRAVKAGGHLYMTVEEVDDQREIDDAFADLTERGLPAVHGEVIEGDVAGYHYYPGRDRVLGWFEAEGLTVVDEGYNQEDGWGYRHFLLRNGS
jgi:ubiquinone/menaquinone biosynthesis C-methylase UbiE